MTTLTEETKFKLKENIKHALSLELELYDQCGYSDIELQTVILNAVTEFLQERRESVKQCFEDSLYDTRENIKERILKCHGYVDIENVVNDEFKWCLEE